jgi:hypothetical protein
MVPSRVRWPIRCPCPHHQVVLPRVQGPVEHWRERRGQRQGCQDVEQLDMLGTERAPAMPPALTVYHVSTVVIDLPSLPPFYVTPGSTVLPPSLL